MQSQNTAILKHLEQGKTLTALNALNLYGALRLAARIAELKERGVRIKSQMIRVGQKHVAAYSISRR